MGSERDANNRQHKRVGMSLSGLWDAFITIAVIVGIVLGTAYIAGCMARTYNKTVHYLDSRIIIIELPRESLENEYIKH